MVSVHSGTTKIRTCENVFSWFVYNTHLSVVPTPAVLGCMTHYHISCCQLHNNFLSFYIESSATDKDINIFQMPLALFGPTDNHAVVNVTIIDDDAVEDEEVFQLQLMISSSLQEIGIMKGTPNVAEALIVDNDG